MSLRSTIADRFGLDASHWVSHAVAILITISSILLVALLWRRLGAIPDPGLILLLTVAVSTYVAGGIAGMVSAAIVLLCSFVLFSHPLYLFRYSEMDWRQVMVIVITCPLIALMVGSLREQVDALKKTAADYERLSETLRQLEGLRSVQHLSEERLRLAAESLRNHALVALDTKGMVVGWNAGAERLLGYSDQEIVGQSYSRFFTREDILARKPELLLEKAQFSGRAEEAGWQVRKGGARFQASLAVTPLQHASGAAAGFLMVVEDVTERVAADEQIRRLRAELDQVKGGGV
jgi:PAS domain S-box-containing protein